MKFQITTPFARKLSSRIDLDLFCVEILSKFFAFS